MRVLKLNQHGGASLITVLFLTILILILTISMTKLMTGELRHAIESENNIKAYYVAESGIEETVLALRRVLASGTQLDLISRPNQNCDKTNPVGSPDADGVLNSFGFGVGGTNFNHNPDITCRRVRTKSSFVNGDLQINESAHYDLTKKGVNFIQLEWDAFDRVQGGTIPLLEITRITYDDNDNDRSTMSQVDPNTIKLTSLFFDSNYSGPGGQNINPLACQSSLPYNANFNCYGDEGGRVEIFCNPTNIGNRCQANIYNFSPLNQNRTVLRLRPYGNRMQYTMKIVDSAGDPVDVILDKAEIDITSRVGGTHRRLQQDISLIPQPLNGLETVFGDDNVCKGYKTIRTEAGENLATNLIANYCRF